MGWFKDKKFKFCRGSLKNLIFRGGGFMKNQYIGGNCLKSGGGGLKKKNGGAVFKEGG